MKRLASALLILTAINGSTAWAQSLLRLRVADSQGVAIPFAVVDASPGGRRVADNVGSVSLEIPGRVDSVLVIVRRIGYQSLSRMLQPGVVVHELTLVPVANALEAVTISERRNSILLNRGFYDRLERVRRGAYTGEFITPEDLDRMGATTLGRAFNESKYVRVERAGVQRQIVLTGRSGCGYTILIDGTRQAGILEEGIAGATSIDPRGTKALLPSTTGIEELIGGLEVVAIEVYPSASTAPAEIQARAMGGRGSCGIIAIWTGRP